MKINFIWIYFFTVFSVFSQSKESYLDSVKRSIESLPAKQQLEIITKIPDGNFVAEVSKAAVLFQKAEKLAIKLNDSLSLGDVIFKQGQLKGYQNKLDESLALTLRAINIFEKSHNYSKAGIVYGGLGYNLKTKNLEKGMYYMRKSIKLLEQMKDSVGINPVYDNYGVLLNMDKKNDSALFYQNKSLFIKKALKDSIGLGYSYANIGNTFAEKGQYELAKKYVDSSSLIRNKIADNYGITVNYVFVGEILMIEKKYKEAIQNLEKCAVLARQYQYKHLEQYCYEQMAVCYENLDDFENAYRWKEKFQTLKDSSNSVQINNRIEELQIQFETEKKEKQLAEAQTDIFKKEMAIKNRTNWLIMAFGLAFLIGLFGFLVYKQQKLRNRQIIKENELKQALIEIENQNNLQEQRLAISKDLHDNIGSQLTFIISSLDNLKYFEFTKEKLYDKFENIAGFTRSTITDLRDTIWAMNKEKITFEDLKSRTTNFIEAAKTSLKGIHFEFNIADENNEITLNSLQGIDVYRIIQEAVHNAVKHAKATKIIVSFEKIDHQIVVSIQDNGIGFEPEKVEAGNGLASMQKRAKEINAVLSIENQNPGTKVQLKFNCQE